MDAAFIGLVVIILVALAFDTPNSSTPAANATSAVLSHKGVTCRRPGPGWR